MLVEDILSTIRGALDILEDRDDALVEVLVCAWHKMLVRHCPLEEVEDCKTELTDLTWDELLGYYFDYLDLLYSR